MKMDNQLQQVIIMKMEMKQENGNTTIKMAIQKMKLIMTITNFNKNKTLIINDLNPQNVHQVILDRNNLWLISENDLELGGLK